MRRGSLAVVALVTLLACSADHPAPTEVGPPAEDPRLACMREHAHDPAHAAVVRALCAELHDLGGVSASVAIVRDDRVVLGTAVGPRCRGQPEPLRADAPLQIGSITKLVTTALALAQAERAGVGLDDPLGDALPELSPPPTLRELLTHTAGLRDPEPRELLARGEAWPAALQAQRVQAGGHVYANANFLLVGRWLERSTGRVYRELLAQEPALASVRARVRLGAAADADADVDAGGERVDPACGHRRVWGWGWVPVELGGEPPLPAWTLPAGGGLASAEDLARLPFALERSGFAAQMLTTRVPSDLPGWDYGLGVRLRGEGDALVLAHSGNTGTHWAELQWSPHHRVAVAVLSSTPQAFKATLHAAFTAATTAAPEQ